MTTRPDRIVESAVPPRTGRMADRRARFDFLSGHRLLDLCSGCPGGEGIRRLANGRPFSLIGYAVDDPLDDRVESFLIECMFAVDAEFGDEVAGDLGHDLVCIP